VFIYVSTVVAVAGSRTADVVIEPAVPVVESELAEVLPGTLLLCSCEVETGNTTLTVVVVAHFGVTVVVLVMVHFLR
jgi:hypothetical protein